MPMRKTLISLTGPAFVAAVAYVDPGNVAANISAGSHYVGTTKIGTDSGLENGTAVVDLDTKVYGTDNLASPFPTNTLSRPTTNTSQFIVDGGIHADLPTGNLQTTIMVVAEAAVAKILALE